MAGKVSVRDVTDGVLDWETVEKLNALLDMEDDYTTAWHTFMSEPKEK